MLTKILKADILKSKILEASFWSILSEFAVKVITPFTYLLLTKFLKPEDFGSVAIITTIVAFLSIIADLGIAKLIIQNNNYKGIIKVNFINHCLSMSIIFGLLLMVFLISLIYPIAEIFSISNNIFDLFILSFNIPFLAINGVLISLLKKDFEFRKIFKVRLICVIIPSVINIIMIFYGYGIRSIVISQLLSSIISVVIIYFSIDFKFSFYYSKKFNHEIFGKSLWNTLEQIFMWLPMSIDIFIMNLYLSKSELGLYTTSRTLFTSAIALSLGAITPVVFSLYSKFNNDLFKLIKIFKSTHYFIFLIASLLGVIVFNFFDYFETFFFNNEWKGIAKITSIVFLVLSINYFVNPFQELFNSLGFFKITSLIVVTNLLITLPFLMFSVKYGLILYLIVRFSFLFLKIIPINYYTKKIKHDLSLFFFFKNTIYIWFFVLINVLNKILLNNLLINILIFFISITVFFLIEIKRIKFLLSVIMNK